MYYLSISPMLLNLQLFAEGGDGGDGGTGAEGETGVTAGVSDLQAKMAAKNPLANVKYGKQEDAAQAIEETREADTVEQPVDRAKEFEKLIKGEYKDLYDQRVQDTIQKRLKSTKEIVDRYNALTPTLEMLAKKYGIKDVNDIEAFNRAIEEDDSYYEEEALEKGLTVAQLKEIRKMERENAELKRQMQEQETRERANQLYAKWMNEAEALKGIYHTFDLAAELQNPKFMDLLRAGVDVRTAYEVIHKDEIIPAAMQFTAKTVEQKLANKIIANGARPVENGTSSQSASLVKSDVSQLTKEDRQEIIRRVQRGERIVF